MKVIAKAVVNGGDGVFIEATDDEVKEIVCSVSGSKPAHIEVGQKIPALDYASTLIKIKKLKDYNWFKEIFKDLEKFNTAAEKLKDSVEKASEIEI